MRQDYAWVRHAYGLNIGKGTRVSTPHGPGDVVGADNCVYVQRDGCKAPERWHPMDVQTELN